ncbi:Calpain-B, partial [Fasciolopsis buskii]
VYERDEKASGTIARPQQSGLDIGRVISPIRAGGADDYLKVLQPKKSTGRMEFNPNLPKTLTPKGYAKLKLMMSVASKQYQTLIKRLNREGTLWEDPDFPATDDSIRIPEMKGKLEWKRPKEINAKADFFVGGASRFDIEQGSVGDCWLLAVISTISSYPFLFDHVVPKEQSIQKADYCGVFRFRFWRFGQWVEVLVDDRLPVYRGTNRLAFMHSSEGDEFWSALTEKAYAKLCGCYNHLSGGTQTEAMEDVTGGICETLMLTPKDRPKDLQEQMEKYAKRCCLMGCSVDSTVIEDRLANGLIAGHAYSVTGVSSVNYRGRRQVLVRCRNPWGGNYEWRGPWSDRSKEWDDVSAAEKKQLDLTFRDDGEFWMSYEDFTSTFTRLEVCHLGLESLEHDQDLRGKRRLEESIFSGEWQKNVNAGGCINNRSTYWTNSQFRFDLVDPDPEDDDEMTTVIIGLMQKDVRQQRGADFLTIGFMLYDIDPNQKTLFTRAQLLAKRAIGKSSFSNSREVTAHFRVKPGSYVVIPSTFEPNQEAKFIVRILSQVPMTDAELDEDNTNHGIGKDIIEAMKLEDMVLNEDQQIEEKFNEICDPQTKSINAVQLGILLNGSTLQDIPGFTGFTKEMLRSMVAAVDNNLTGTVELPEFMDLWSKAKGWKMIFLAHDTDGSGFFRSNEFREALTTGGYNVSNKLFNALVHRYQDPDTERMCFEDFMLCSIRLKNMFDNSVAQPKNNQGETLFSREDYLRFGVYV